MIPSRFSTKTSLTLPGGCHQVFLPFTELKTHDILTFLTGLLRLISLCNVSYYVTCATLAKAVNDIRLKSSYDPVLDQLHLAHVCPQVVEVLVSRPRPCS